MLSCSRKKVKVIKSIITIHYQYREIKKRIFFYPEPWTLKPMAHVKGSLLRIDSICNVHALFHNIFGHNKTEICFLDDFSSKIQAAPKKVWCAGSRA